MTAAEMTAEELAELEGFYAGFEWFFDHETGYGYLRIPQALDFADYRHVFALLRERGWCSSGVDEFFRSPSPDNVIYHRLERRA